MPQEPLHRDLLSDDHMERTGNLTRSQAGALARLSVMADLWELPNLQRLVRNTVAFGASVEGKRSAQVVEILSAQRHVPDDWAEIGYQGVQRALQATNGASGDQGQGATVEVKEKPRRRRFGFV